MNDSWIYMAKVGRVLVPDRGFFLIVMICNWMLRNIPVYGGGFPTPQTKHLKFGEKVNNIWRRHEFYIKHMWDGFL